MTAPLPDWLDPLPGAEQMRATDRWAIEECGVPSLDLMERAGAGLALQTDRIVPRGPIAIVCGKGNNGGDGLVAGRLLRELRRTVRILLLADPSEYRGDAAANLQRLDRAHEPFDPEALGDAAVVVDAIFGTGFDGEPRGPAADAIEAMAVLDVSIVSADIASGVDASTGEAAQRVGRRERDSDLRRRQARALDQPGQAAHGLDGRRRHRDPAGRTGDAGRRAAYGARPRARARP